MCDMVIMLTICIDLLLVHLSSILGDLWVFIYPGQHVFAL